MNNQIKKDLYRYRPEPFSYGSLFKGLRSQGFRYTFILRKLKESKNKVSYLFWKLLLSHYSYKYGFQIGPSTEIGSGFYIGHFGTVVISARATIGKNCNISPGVTIGRDHRGKRKGAPTIGDFVWIGTNAILVGNITIGNKVLIAPGSFVNFDVPEGSLVIGNPGKIIPKENASEGYINNVLKEDSNHEV